MCRDVGAVLGEGWGKDGHVAPLILRMFVPSYLGL